jgi:hypothetical protein
MIVIEINSLPVQVGQDHQRWQAWLEDGELLCVAREPFLAAARALLERGVSPGERLAMRHKGADHVSLTSTVGGAAALRVSDDPQGQPRFRKFESYPDKRPLE